VKTEGEENAEKSKPVRTKTFGRGARVLTRLAVSARGVHKRTVDRARQLRNQTGVGKEGKRRLSLIYTQSCYEVIWQAKGGRPRPPEFMSALGREKTHALDLSVKKVGSLIKKQGYGEEG